MKKTNTIRLHIIKILTIVLVGSSTNAFAATIDGVILITQASALAGHVTAGDTPGFPVTISQSGSYRLASNLTVTNQSSDAIAISANGVNIDLNGFSIVGPCLTANGCDANATGVGVNGSNAGNYVTDVVVTNGSVRGMVIGMDLGDNSKIDKVKIESNQLLGLNLGHASSVTNSTIAYTQAGDALRIYSGSIIGNIILGNGDGGIHEWTTPTSTPTDSVVILDNMIQDNHSLGIIIGKNSGYGRNILSGNYVIPGHNFPQVSGGKSMGTNLCNGIIC
jgi:hypothetical protein